MPSDSLTKSLNKSHSTIKSSKSVKISELTTQSLSNPWLFWSSLKLEPRFLPIRTQLSFFLSQILYAVFGFLCRMLHFKMDAFGESQEVISKSFILDRDIIQMVLISPMYYIRENIKNSNLCQFKWKEDL